MKDKMMIETINFLEKLLKEGNALNYNSDYIAYYRVKYFNDDEYHTYAGIFSAYGVLERSYKLDLDILFNKIEKFELTGLTDILDPNNKPQFMVEEAV